MGFVARLRLHVVHMVSICWFYCRLPIWFVARLLSQAGTIYIYIYIYICRCYYYWKSVQLVAGSEYGVCVWEGGVRVCVCVCVCVCV